MTDALQYRIEEGVAVLGIATGAHGFDHDVRVALMAALDRAESDDSVRGVVLTGAGPDFPGDIPHDEMILGEAEPTLGAVCARVARFSKPVCAALRGEVRGGGFELALAAHGRVALSGAKLGHDAVMLGLIPSGGATQRLPRIAGAALALEMLAAGRNFPAGAAALRDLLDAVVEGDVVAEALQFLRDKGTEARAIDGQRQPPGFADPMEYQAVVQRRRKSATLSPEAEAAVDCIEAAQLLPIQAGLAMEATRFADLAATARARGLVHADRVAKSASAAPGMDVSAITVLGDGPAAFPLIMEALAAGLHVTVAEQRSGGAGEIAARARDALEELGRRGRITETEIRDRLERLDGGTSEDGLEQARLVVEACAAPGHAVGALVERILSLTGADVPVLIGSDTGLHAGDMEPLFGPRVMGAAFQSGSGARLVELALAGDVDTTMLARVRALLARMGREVVECRPANGLVVQGLKAALYSAAEWCVGQGATPAEVDAALAWPRGPFAMMDAEGLAAQIVRLRALGWGDGWGELSEVLIEAGRGGRSAGKGFFDYSGDAATYDAEARELVDRWRGSPPGPMPAVLIRRRLWTAMFRSGLGLVERGVVASGGEVDLAGVEAIGLPRASGGPMKAGELRGLLAVRRELEAWAAEEPELWSPSPLLDDMVKNGRGFGA